MYVFPQAFDRETAQRVLFWHRETKSFLSADAFHTVWESAMATLVETCLESEWVRRTLALIRFPVLIEIADQSFLALIEVADHGFLALTPHYH